MSMLPKTHAAVLALAFVPAVFAFVACTDESASPSAADAAVTPNAIAEASTDATSFTVAASSITKVSYLERTYQTMGPICNEAGLYRRFSFDLAAKTVRVETCDPRLDAGATTDDTRALTDDNVTALQAALTELRFVPRPTNRDRMCAVDGLNRVLTLVVPDRTYSIAQEDICPPSEPSEFMVSEGFPGVHAKVFELAGLPVPQL